MSIYESVVVSGSAAAILGNISGDVHIHIHKAQRIDVPNRSDEGEIDCVHDRGAYTSRPALLTGYLDVAELCQRFEALRLEDAVSVKGVSTMTEGLIVSPLETRQSNSVFPYRSRKFGDRPMYLQAPDIYHNTDLLMRNFDAYIACCFAEAPQKAQLMVEPQEQAVKSYMTTTDRFQKGDFYVAMLYSIAESVRRIENAVTMLMLLNAWCVLSLKPSDRMEGLLLAFKLHLGARHPLTRIIELHGAIPFATLCSTPLLDFLDHRSIGFSPTGSCDKQGSISHPDHAALVLRTIIYFTRRNAPKS